MTMRTTLFAIAALLLAACTKEVTIPAVRSKLDASVLGSYTRVSGHGKNLNSRWELTADKITVKTASGTPYFEFVVIDGTGVGCGSASNAQALQAYITLWDGIPLVGVQEKDSLAVLIVAFCFKAQTFADGPGIILIPDGYVQSVLFNEAGQNPSMEQEASTFNLVRGSVKVADPGTNPGTNPGTDPGPDPGTPPVSNTHTPILKSPSQKNAVDAPRPTLQWSWGYALAGSTLYDIDVYPVNAAWDAPATGTAVWQKANYQHQGDASLAQQVVVDADLPRDANYAWSVRAVPGEDASTPSDFAPYAYFTLSSNIGAPDALTPIDASVVNIYKPAIKWSRLSWASSYKLEVMAADDSWTPGAVVIDQTVVPSTYDMPTTVQFTPTSDLAVGKYVWHVRGLQDALLGPWSTTTATFSVTDPLQLDSPPEGWSVSATNTAQLTWYYYAAVSGTTQYQVALSKDGGAPSNHGKSHSGAADAMQVYTTGALAAGSYSWYVEVWWGGTLHLQSPTRTFTVTP
jgi:hypothetical protein